MTAFLVSAGPMPFTAAEIRLAIGLEGTDLDGTIEGGIALHCMGKGVRKSRWLVTCDERFERNCDLLGAIKTMGPEREHFGKLCREVVTQIDPKAIRAAKTAIIRWCADQLDIHEALVRQSRNERAAFAVAAE